MEESRRPEPSELFDSRPLDRPPAPIDPELPKGGQLVGDYALIEQIGAGGFSIVWRAKRCTSGETVAIKLPRVPEFVAHLTREALMNARFQDPAVVPVLDIRLDHRPPFLVMPFIEGADLELPEKAPEPRDIVAALRRFRKVADVVARLHEAGIVHGDLKPGNLRFDPEVSCHLLDLGLARHQVTVRQASTLRASIVSVTGEKIAGTLEFMAPEVMSGARPEQAADVYALGVLLHSMLCGRPPAFGVSPGELNPFLPPGTTDFLCQLLAPEPRRRLPNAGALLPVVDWFIAVEERCLRRRNGHARRRVFQERMRTLGRGVKVLGLIAMVALTGLFGLPHLKALAAENPGVIALACIFGGFPLAVVAFLTGVTTINAWILSIPEKTYKNRRGHPWWTFMMQ
jgi:serine/threonine protein kinase